jgi:hypothetical protein
MTTKTTLAIPKGCEDAVKAIREEYPHLSLSKILKTLLHLGAANVTPEAIKDALLKP